MPLPDPSDGAAPRVSELEGHGEIGHSSAIVGRIDPKARLPIEVDSAPVVRADIESEALEASGSASVQILVDELAA